MDEKIDSGITRTEIMEKIIEILTTIIKNEEEIIELLTEKAELIEVLEGIP